MFSVYSVESRVSRVSVGREWVEIMASKCRGSASRDVWQKIVYNVDVDSGGARVVGGENM